MNPVKLHYFKGRGRAETTRWMLAINNIDFINISLEDHTDFDILKASGKLPFNQLPLLEIDNIKLSQSSAMISYLARRGDLYGKTKEEASRCDMLLGAVGDFNIPALQFAFKADKDGALRDLDASLKRFGKHFEFALSQNKTPFLVGKKTSMADIIMGESLTSFIEFSPNCLDNYPQLKRFQENVVSEKNIKEYLNSDNRWPLPDEQYVIDIARVLCRPLPSHMADPNRFVKD